MFQKKVIFIFSILLAGLILPIPLYSLSIESAREKIKNEDYEEAIKELNTILESDSENVEAIELLGEIEKIGNKKRAEALTAKALVEIDNRRFEAAYKYLKEAIVIDPENLKARQLYLSIHDVMKVEEESIALEATGEEKKTVPGEAEAAPLSEEEKQKAPPRYDTAIVKLSTSYDFANSNKLSYLDSRISMIGARVDARYYFDFFEKRLGVSVDYTVYPLKISGDERIKFIAHRVNASGRFRMFFFEDGPQRLTVGARLNYHFFTLQNLLEQGAYNFKQIYGPSLGIFISDPVVYRFVKNDFFKNFGLEGEFNYLFLIGQGAAPSSLELYLGAYYDLERFRFSLGYRLYSIATEAINETYNDIEVGAGYRF
jgi:tetratricopeptide (TPR) repeat protein